MEGKWGRELSRILGFLSPWLYTLTRWSQWPRWLMMAETGKAAMGGVGVFCGLSDWVVFKESNGDSSHLVWDTKGSGERRRREWRSPVSKVGQMKQPLYQKTFLCLIPDFSCKISISFLHCVVYLAKVWMMNACRARCEKEITKLLRCFFGFITGTLVQGIFFFVRSCIFHSAY